MRTGVIASLALLMSTGAVSQVPVSPPANDSMPIVVQGDRDREQKIEHFIKVLTPAPIRGQLSRFESAVCPTVRGIAEQQARQVEDRIRQVAKAVGVQVAKPGCITNLAVFVTDDKPGTLHQLARHPGMFPEDWDAGQIRRFERDASPVAAWQTDREVWQDGIGVSGRDASAPETKMSVPSGGGAGGKGGSQQGHTLTASHAVATRLKPSARPTFAKAVMVVRLDALAGLTPIQLADYAVMRTFVRSDPEKLTQAQATDSILGMFDVPMGSAVPQSLTAWDLSFLKSFYSSTTNMYAEYQRAQMRELMRRELDRQSTAEKKAPSGG